jgi:hypothetical protein
MGVSGMLQEKEPLDGIVATPLQVTVETPDKLSLTEPDRLIGDVVKIVPSNGEFIAKTGMVLSMFRVTLALVVSPFASVAVSETT